MLSTDWAIGPTDPHKINTYIERPAIDARLLFWLAALHAIDGMLYGNVDIWAVRCPRGFTVYYECPNAFTPHVVLIRSALFAVELAVPS